MSAELPTREIVYLKEYLEKILNERDQHLKTLVDERDRQYNQRFQDSDRAVQVGLSSQKTAIDAALTAQKTATDAAFAASEKAIVKAETSTEKRFEGVNEFRKTLDDAQRVLMPRNEALALIENQNTRITAADKQIGLIQIAMATFVTQSQHIELQKQVNDLRESRSAIHGQATQSDKSTAGERWAIGIGLVGAGLILSVVLGGIEIAMRLSGH
jgi:hypothetical protein